MDGNATPSPKPTYPIESADAENLLKSSDFLVATIQETRDKIYQIEDIFCKELYPNFQSMAKSLQKIMFEAKRAAEYEWKDKGKDLLLQIEELQFDKQLVLDENERLKLAQSPEHVKELQEELKIKTRELAAGRELEQDLRKLLESKDSVILHNEKRVKELEAENDLIRNKKLNLDLEAEELRLDLMKKFMEVDEGMELHSRLIQLVQSKASVILQKEMELKGKEERITGLLAKLKGLEKEVEAFQEGLKEKTNQLENGKELQENLSKKIELQALEISNNRHLVDDYEAENKQLRGQVRIMQENVNGLQKELHKKIEVEEERNMQQKLIQQNDSELLKVRQEVEELQKEKKLLLVKLKGLEEKVGKLQVNLGETHNKSTQEIESHGRLLQQIETRESELVLEKNKMRVTAEAYRRLKSRYNFLCTKFGLTQENMIPQTSAEDERDLVDLNKDPLESPGTGKKVSNDSVLACQVTKEKVHQDNLEDKSGVKLNQRSSSCLPCTSSFSVAPKTTSNATLISPAGKKRAVSHWRGTRSHQNQSGPDPHDDFLDTPLENMRENFKKAKKEDIHQLSADPVPNVMDLDSSDDETQDLSGNLGLQKLAPVTETKGFKYVEPIRKKAERKNLKGVKCKQCRKFYDAVLPDAGGDAPSVNKKNLRCEHHDGVSRHRHRDTMPHSKLKIKFKVKDIDSSRNKKIKFKVKDIDSSRNKIGSGTAPV